MEVPKTFPPSAGETNSNFKMIDVGAKTPTRRRAIARGRISMAPDTLQRIREGTLPKGNVLALAETAGILAAKKTSDLLPLCHPLPIEAVRVWCELEDASVLV